ncbi:MAG: hypothetical protein KDB52_05465 [Solirubrobacterales bacterium]|nr:hypothetical protein [Solirubrobacterales bacterium]
MTRAARLALVVLSLASLAAVSGTTPAAARNYIPSFAAVKTDKGPVFRDGCLVYTNRVTSPPCHYGAVGSEKKAVIFGDSHALQWTPALIEIANKRGWELTMLLRKSCTAAIVNISPVCNKWRHNALKRIKAEQPALVFVASNTAPNTFVMKGGKRLSRAASEPHFRKGMFDTLLMLRKAGSQVTVMRDLPMSEDFLPPVCVSQNRNAPGRCTFPARRPLSQAYDFAAAKRLKAVQIIDPLPKVCPGGQCRAVHGNVLKYRDRGHISATYSRLLTNWLNARLQDPFSS